MKFCSPHSTLMAAMRSAFWALSLDLELRSMPRYGAFLIMSCCDLDMTCFWPTTAKSGSISNTSGSC